MRILYGLTQKIEESKCNKTNFTSLKTKWKLQRNSSKLLLS